ncbi:MAG: Fe(2+)-trafficking protein [Gemmatimonadales bacterium]
MSNLSCTRCGEKRPQLAAPPFKDDLGARIQEQICRVCWGEWLQRQMQLINHYALDVRTDQAREFLRRNVAAFLFQEGTSDEIDTSQQGKIGP